MHVVSSLADIEFTVGRIGRSGRDLVIESGDDSTIATKVTITPQDALRSIRVLLTSPSVWAFVLTLPFRLGSGAGGGNGDVSAWERRRKGKGLNKPW